MAIDAKAAIGKKVLVTQVRSLSGHTDRERATATALGLGRPGKKKEFTLSPTVIGKIKRIRHLVEVKVI